VRNSVEFLASIAVRAMGVVRCEAVIAEWQEAQAAVPAKSAREGMFFSRPKGGLLQAIVGAELGFSRRRAGKASPTNGRNKHTQSDRPTNHGFGDTINRVRRRM
jgi:hypothetical protein